MVLLKNTARAASKDKSKSKDKNKSKDKDKDEASSKPLLPYSSGLNSIAIVGPNADATTVMLGNYHGRAPYITRYFTTTLLRFTV